MQTHAVPRLFWPALPPPEQEVRPVPGDLPLPLLLVGVVEVRAMCHGAGLSRGEHLSIKAPRALGSSDHPRRVSEQRALE